jgi:uncharacterized membrane protein YccC
MMESTAAPNVAGTLAGLFGLVALVVGICSRRSASAIKWGSIIGALCVALFVALLIAYGNPHEIDWSYAIGRFIGYGVMSVVFALIGYGIRKLFSAIFGLFRKAEPKVPPQ